MNFNIENLTLNKIKHSKVEANIKVKSNFRKILPIPELGDIERFKEELLNNKNSSYALIFQIGIESGLRVTDILELRYSDFDFNNNSFTIIENKTTKARQTKAIKNVFKSKMKPLIKFFSSNLTLLDKVCPNIAPVSSINADNLDEIRDAIINFKDKQELLNMITDETLALSLFEDIKESLKDVQGKKRTAVLSIDTINKIKLRRLSSNSDLLFIHRNEKPLSRIAVYKVFTAIAKKLGLQNVGTHSMRKTFAKNLLTSNNNDIGLVMEIIGHADQKTTLKYLGYTDESTKKATENMFKAYKSSATDESEALEIAVNIEPEQAQGLANEGFQLSELNRQDVHNKSSKGITKVSVRTKLKKNKKKRYKYSKKKIKIYKN